MSCALPLALLSAVLGAGCAGPYGERRSDEVVRRYGDQLVAGPYVSPIAYEHYVLAMLYQNAGQLEEAVDELRRALGSDGTSAYLRWRLADALISCGRLDEAREELSAALRLEPEAAEAYVVRARLAARLRDHAGVESALLQAITLDPKLEEAYLLLASTQRERNQPERALRTMRALAERVPSASAHEALGRAALRARDRKNARLHLGRAIELDNARNEARLELARTLIGDGDTESGLQLLRSAAERTRDVTVLLELARAAAHNKRVTQALAVLDRLEEEASSGRGRLTIATAFLDVGVPLRAQRIAERVLADERKIELRATAYQVLARAAELRGEPAEALAAWRQIGPTEAEYATAVIARARMLRVRGRDAESLALLKDAFADCQRRQRLDDADQLSSASALLQAELGERDAAIEALQAAAVVRPASTILQLSLATLEQRAGRTIDAVRRLEPRAKAGEQAALHLLGDTLVAANVRLPEAVTYLERAESVAPHDAEIADSLGAAYLALGHVADAQRLLERANHLSPGDLDVLTHLAKLYQRLDQPALAVAALRGALATRPPEPVRQALEAQLLMLERGRLGTR